MSEKLGCSFPGCGRKKTAKGLCSVHYYQRRRGVELFALNSRWTMSMADRVAEHAKGVRTCPGCLVQKPLSAYGLASGKFHKVQHRCKPCKAVDGRRLKYKLTPESFQELLDKQDNRCGMCRATFESKIVVDHDHACCPTERSCGKCVRGLLCMRCNLGLGTVERYKHMADQYLAEVPG